MADIFKWTNDAKTTLDGAHNDTTTTINVATGDGALFPSPAAGEAFAITIKKTDGTAEVCYCTSRTGDALTVTRGEETSLGAAIAQTYVGGETVGLRVTAGTLVEFIQNSLLSATGDIMYASAANTPARLAIGNSGQVPAVNAGGTALAYWAPKGYWTGLDLSNDTDTDHDINITAGEATDSTGAYVLKLTSEITKQIDAAWAVGDDAGGLFTGTVAADTTYHLFLIRKDSDGSIDAGFDTSLTAANKPSGYTAYRHIYSFLTDASANIINFVMNGDEVIYKTAILDLSVTNPGTSVQAITLSVPSGIKLDALFRAEVYNPGGSVQASDVLISSYDATAAAPNSASSPLSTMYCRDQMVRVFGHFRMRTDTIKRVRYQFGTSASDIEFLAATYGYAIDRRLL